MSERTEIRLDVDGLSLAAIAWGPADGVPVLALHGWLDNAESFGVLGPLLPSARVVALDLPGNGLSDHRSADASYNIWDDLPQIFGVMDALGWERATLLGHSRGAIQSILAAAALPARVARVVTLDGLTVRPVADEDTPALLGRYLEDRARYAARPERIFRDETAFLHRRRAYGVSDAVARRLAIRALEPVAQGLRYRGDPRLMGSSVAKLTGAQSAAVLAAVRAPVLCLWAASGLRQRDGWAAKPEAALADATTHVLPGDHHFHMDPDVAPRIAALIQPFLAAGA